MSVCMKGEVDLQELIRQVKLNQRFREVGAIAAFLGVVRSTSATGEAVDHLELEAHEDKTEDDLAKISNEIKESPGVVEVVIQHAVGVLEKGDPIMAVVVAGKSRTDVFPALIDAVERAKREARIWKKEVLSSGQSYWVSNERAVEK